jgi:2-haloacid dehalogenase
LLSINYLRPSEHGERGDLEMTEAKFDGIKACVFDAYGTLFDVHSAVGRHQVHLGDKASAVSALWRTKQLEYTWLRSLMDKYVDFWQVTGDALDYALESYGIHDIALRQDLMSAYKKLDCYSEVPEVLSKLKEAGFTTAILSNGSPEMLKAAVDATGLSASIDATLSVHELRTYKPRPSVYQLAVNHLNVEAKQISFQSSNAWDASGAAAFGFQVAWVNRFEQARERLPGQVRAEIRTLGELLPLVTN